MKITFILTLLTGHFLFLKAQNWSGTTPGNIYYSDGNVGIGVVAPTQKLDLRGGYLHIVNNIPNSYSFVGRDANLGNDSYIYHKFSTNFHMLGSSRNGSGLLRKIGFSIGTTDSESDVKMSIGTNGYVGVGINSPLSQFHVASDNTHSINLSRTNGTYGFRILRNAQEGVVYFQIGTTPTTWETKIRMGEGDGINTNLIFNPDGGNVLINKISQTNSNYKLDINGKIRSNEIIVNSTGADFVFDKAYHLLTLEEVENYITLNNHLPDIEPASEMMNNGIEVGKLEIKLLQKIEELTLYIIDMKKELNKLKTENEKFLYKEKK